MKRSLLFLTILTLIANVVLFASGSQEASPRVQSIPESSDRRSGSYWIDDAMRVYPEYARGFSVEYRQSEAGEYALLSVQQRWKGDGLPPIQYLLLPPGSNVQAQEIEGDVYTIQIPVKRLATLSSTYITPLLLLGEEERLVAHDSKDYVGNPGLLDAFRRGEIQEVGNGPDIDIERLLLLSPDLVMATGTGGEWNVTPALEDAGLSSVYNADYLENTPLGRAEWLKFMALFVGKEQKANKLFSDTTSRYCELKQQVENVTEQDKPQVLVNNPFGGSWVVPGGDGYVAALIADAGGSYIWRDMEGSVSKSLDTETVFLKASDADVWIHFYGWNSIADLHASDGRFSDLPAVRSGNLYHNDGCMTPGGGNEFYGSGISYPDRILKDLISIFHPSLSPDHTLRYYRRLPPR